MPIQETSNQQTELVANQVLFDALREKNFDKVKEIINDNPKIDLNCVDENELSPLQHACHFGDVDLARFLIDHGAGVNFANRKDNYTPLMFASISNKADVVKLLLERGVDIKIENCVHRNAAQMAAFVGQTKIVSIINSWIPYESSVECYTKCRELEDKPRISSPELAKLLHNYIVYPSLHPVKLLLFIKENPDLIRYANEFIYVLENLSSKSLKSPSNEECLSLKYYYLCYLIEYCIKNTKSKDNKKMEYNNTESFDAKFYEKSIENIIRRLIRRDEYDEIRICTQQLDHFILECMMKFPYTQLAIFKTMAFALTKREAGDMNALAILTQTLNGPRMFNQPAEACFLCGESNNNKKCSRCKSIYYCGQSCQKADWFQHKKICKSPEEEPLLNDEDDNH